MPRQQGAILRMFGPACIYGQVIKARHKNRVVAIDRKLIIGSKEQLEDALFNSEDSDTMNISFVERHNLTIRKIFTSIVLLVFVIWTRNQSALTQHNKAA